MNTKTPRYHEIDALRVIALAMLIIYHIFISYQPFANTLFFLQYNQLLENYWFLGELMNIWRIPVLFVISGLAVGFLLKRRTVKAVVIDRMMRLVPPLVFGWLIICPIFPAIYAAYHGEDLGYWPNVGHLWFLVNLSSYTILLLPLLALVKKSPENSLIRGMRRVLPLTLIVAFPLFLGLETALSQPPGFSYFPIRYWYGLICYAAGFLFLSTGDAFWTTLRKVCHVALPAAFLLYLGRMGVIEWWLLQANHWTTSFESGFWMLAFLGYGSLLLNQPVASFAYLNKAVFPIYILHMPVQQIVAAQIFPWGLGPEITFLLHALFTLAICGLLYEFVVRNIKLLYPVMGLKAAKPIPPKPMPLPASPALQPAAPALGPRIGQILTIYVLAPLVVLPSIVGAVALSLAGGMSSGIPENPNRVPLSTEPTAFRGHQYQVFETEEPIAWADAKARCEAMGGHLVIIDNQEENDFLTSIAVGNGFYHLGATDQQNEGEWLWVDGTPVQFTNWNPGEPNNHDGDEDYLNAFFDLWPQWNDGPEFANGFVCEWNAVPGAGQKPLQGTGS